MLQLAPTKLSSLGRKIKGSKKDGYGPYNKFSWVNLLVLILYLVKTVAALVSVFVGTNYHNLYMSTGLLELVINPGKDVRNQVINMCMIIIFSDFTSSLIVCLWRPMHEKINCCCGKCRRQSFEFCTVYNFVDKIVCDLLKINNVQSHIFIQIIMK